MFLLQVVVELSLLTNAFITTVNCLQSSHRNALIWRVSRSTGSSGSSGSSSSSSSSSSSLNDSCSYSSFERCLTKIKDVTENNHLAFASTKRDLNEACRKLKEGVTCADDHMKFCTRKNQRAVFEEVVRGTRQVLTSLCVRGEFQENYLRFASCYKNVSISPDKCALWLKTVQRMPTTVKNDENVDEELKKFCCAYRESVNCQIRFVRKDCGETAVEFFEKYLSEISNSLIHQHCATYTFGANSCRIREDDDNYNQSTLPLSSIALYYITLIITVSLGNY